MIRGRLTQELGVSLPGTRSRGEGSEEMHGVRAVRRLRKFTSLLPRLLEAEVSVLTVWPAPLSAGRVWTVRFDGPKGRLAYVCASTALCEHILGVSYSPKCVKYFKAVSDEAQRNVFMPVRADNWGQSGHCQEA